MRLLSFLILAAGGYACWLTEFDRISPKALHLVEWSSSLPVPIWQILFPVGIVLFYLSQRKKEEDSIPKKEKHKIQPRKKRPAPETNLEREILVSPREEVPEIPAMELPTDQFIAFVEGADKKDSIRKKIAMTKLPIGTKLRMDPQKGVPFGMRLDALTPEKCKKSIALFAEFLNEIPTPPRAIVEFHSVIDSGIPKQRIVQGIFRQKFTGGIIVTGLHNSVEIRFNCPDEMWSEQPNMDKKF